MRAITLDNAPPSAAITSPLAGTTVSGREVLVTIEASDAWAVGDLGTIRHWDGSSWSSASEQAGTG